MLVFLVLIPRRFPPNVSPEEYSRDPMCTLEAKGRVSPYLKFQTRSTARVGLSEKGVYLWYDGTRWLLSRTTPGAEQLYNHLAEYSTEISKVAALVGDTTWGVLDGQKAKKRHLAVSRVS